MTDFPSETQLESQEIATEKVENGTGFAHDLVANDCHVQTIDLSGKCLKRLGKPDVRRFQWR